MNSIVRGARTLPILNPRLAAFDAAPGFDRSFWLPGEVIVRFFENTDRE
jgi:hypothetical protein